jgi:NAD-dependent deacetylase
MRNIVFLSGAGISAESGISTFRDAGGLWDTYNVMDVCSAEAFRRNRQFVLAFYNKRRRELAGKAPNAAHRMVAELQREFPGRVLNITQNIDDLFEKAGCQGTVHLHGELTKARCETCGHIWSIGYADLVGTELCPRCGAARVRHHVVMFNEQAPEYTRLYEALDGLSADRGMLVVIGTSGLVLPVEEFARYAPYRVLNNLEPQEAIDDRVFSVHMYEKAGDAAPKIAELAHHFLSAGRGGLGGRRADIVF